MYTFWAADELFSGGDVSVVVRNLLLNCWQLRLSAAAEELDDKLKFRRMMNKSWHNETFQRTLGYNELSLLSYIRGNVYGDCAEGSEWLNQHCKYGDSWTKCMPEDFWQPMFELRLFGTTYMRVVAM